MQESCRDIKPPEAKFLCLSINELPSTFFPGTVGSNRVKGSSNVDLVDNL
jgi:hypothetical protein